ncbi:hypothetical protein WISP_20109 [Willisornis vidua]|uniref:Uncharacterized protein n=1 Tax=Willisornis vidua TaxID=1566151 RepID=A0ABQ9DSL3_9PASS|nr:hypothetical protein WISP_20109 [Willisornis vidua]
MRGAGSITCLEGLGSKTQYLQAVEQEEKSTSLKQGKLVLPGPDMFYATHLHQAMYSNPSFSAYSAQISVSYRITLAMIRVRDNRNLFRAVCSPSVKHHVLYKGEHIDLLQLLHVDLLHFNHRNTERVGVEGTLQITQFQTPCHGQGHLPLDHVAESTIESGLTIICHHQAKQANAQ